MSFDQTAVWLVSTPAGPFVVLLFLLAGLGLMLWKAQRTGKLDLSNMFKDDAGKESGLRFAILGSWVISSWGLMALVVSKSEYVVPAYICYLLFWSGAPIAAKLIERWNGTLPWSKP
jgi:hypothetical protein